MRFAPVLIVLLAGCSFAQAPNGSFAVASVKTSPAPASRDDRNRIAAGPAGFSARNVTLKRLIAEAHGVQSVQVLGPAWIDSSQYEIEARTEAPVARDALRPLLQSLLAERFRLALHRESREMRAYELVLDKGGPKIRPTTLPADPAAGWETFQGSLPEFADLLSVQLSIALPADPSKPGVAGEPIPVVDRTGLTGIYNFNVDLKPEPGADMFILWQRTLREQFGLRLESRKTKVDVLVVDRAERVPAAN